MASGTYDHQSIEKKWQDFWVNNKTFKCEVDTTKPKYYVLDMFPYPSGDGLHVGHPEGYTATDIVSRYKRMRGFNVLHPMGWDSFGLPAERHAVRTGEHPAIITKRNCDNFRRQIQALGFSYDWDREIATSDPDYYKWTQWIFQVLFERGLAYQHEAAVNWCPAMGTVLANEEVKDGKYVETGDPVEKRMMKQWMLKITAYSERLLEDLDGLDWPEGIKAMQREWIGRSEGADVIFKVAGSDKEFMIFTTRPDTLFGATYCVLAPEHPFTMQIATPEQRDAVAAYIESASKRSAQDRMKEEREKTGVFTGAYAVNPVNGKEIPIWTADYVLAEYGYGAIMAVPAHDTRDYEFATKFNLPIIEVISGGDITREAHTGDGVLVNSPLIDGLRVADAKKKINAWLEEKGLGKGTVNYRLRDWLFSRQRYWGEPFPLVTLEDGTIRMVPMTDQPVALPPLDDFRPTADGQPPLARATEWLNTTDPQTGQPAVRETNTMPQWAGSCWYFLRFCDAQNADAAWSKEAESYWMPVDLYIGGAEHAVLHLLYSRFWHKVLFDAGYVSTKEPFQKLFNQGMILAYSYQDDNGKYYYPHQVEKKGDGYVVKETGTRVNTQIEKMSKSRYNVVNPDTVVKEYGADAMRLYEMFMGPLDRDKPWTDEGVQGVHRFIKRVWALFIAEDGNIHPRIVGGAPGTPLSRVASSEEDAAPGTPLSRVASEKEVTPGTPLSRVASEAGRTEVRRVSEATASENETLPSGRTEVRRVSEATASENKNLPPACGGTEGGKSDPAIVKTLHHTVKQVTTDLDNMQFNTAIARMMEFVNAAMKTTVLDKNLAERFILTLAPFAPHIAEEIWHRLGHANTLAYEQWPTYDESLLVEDTLDIPVQVNGKLRAVLTIPKDADKDTVLQMAKADAKVVQQLEGKTVVKEIYVPGKMVNLVVK